MATLTIVSDIPADYVSRTQLRDMVQALRPAVDFIDGATIVIVANKIAVGAIPTSSVTGLDAALTGKVASADFWTNLLAATTVGFVRRTSATAVEIIAAQTAVADLAGASLPANGAISALTSSANTTQAEFNALRDTCEALRDELAETQAKLNTLLARLRVTGGAKIIAD